MFAVIFICGNLFLRVAGKIAKNAKIRTRKNFVPRGRIKGKGEEVCVINFAVKRTQQSRTDILI